MNLAIKSKPNTHPNFAPVQRGGAQSINKPSRSKQLEATKMASAWQGRNVSCSPRHEVQKAYDSLTAAGVVLNGFWHPTTALLKRLTARLEQAN